MWRRRMSFIALFGIFAHSAIAQTLAAVPADHLATPVIGQTITVTGRLSTVQCSTWRVVAVNRNGFDVSQCDGNTAFSLSSNGGLVKITDPSGATLVAFTPSALPLPFPLTVGKAWTGTYGAYTKFNSAEWKGSQSCRIPVYEKVVLQSMSVGAYKIVCQDTWSAGIIGGTSTITSWYAPQVESIVKVVNSDFPIWDMQVQSFSTR